MSRDAFVGGRTRVGIRFGVRILVGRLFLFAFLCRGVSLFIIVVKPNAAPRLRRRRIALTAQMQEPEITTDDLHVQWPAQVI